VRKRSRTRITVSWRPPRGGARVIAYRVYLNGLAKGRTAKRTYKFRGLRCGHRYRIAVAAVDARGQRSRKISMIARTAPCPRR
jgi:hypothetical protein